MTILAALLPSALHLILAAFGLAVLWLLILIVVLANERRQ